MAGITNAGNTCYFSSLLQCLLNLEDLQALLERHKKDNEERSDPHKGNWPLDLFFQVTFPSMLCHSPL